MYHFNYFENQGLFKIRSIHGVETKSKLCKSMLTFVFLQRVSEGALSPDGTVLATASHDGYVKFWQIYIEGGQNQPR